MTEQNTIQFILNGASVSLADVGADQTLLDFLRLDQGLTGTKEGCAEGDCGACTVLVGRLMNGELIYEPVNACIRFLASVDGCHVVSVEHLIGSAGALHPVQQAMVNNHGSQCGFCTPGFVMSLYALWMNNPTASEPEIESALQGNLCRCTGYAPIIKAAQQAGQIGSPSSDRLVRESASVKSKLQEMKRKTRLTAGPDGNIAIIPSDVDDLAACLLEHPNATLVAGATDVGLWVTKFLRPIGPAIFTAHLEELRHVQEWDAVLTIGAGVSYSDFFPYLLKHFPHLKDYWDRIAGWQVRNMGTIGGNIANGSPIGDTPPALIAMNAEVTLRRGADRRVLPLEVFFIDYGKQDINDGEFVESITIPFQKADSIDAAYKISKRRDEDISAVAVGIHVERAGSKIANPRIAFGGMAATPKRAARAEAALEGAEWNEASFAAAAEELDKDFQPLSDWRASADYRLLVAKNLLRRFYLENSSDHKEPAQLRSA